MGQYIQKVKAVQRIFVLGHVASGDTNQYGLLLLLGIN